MWTAESVDGVGACVPETESVPVCRKITYVTNVTDMLAFLKSDTPVSDFEGACFLKSARFSCVTDFVTDVTDMLAFLKSDTRYQISKVLAF